MEDGNHPAANRGGLHLITHTGRDDKDGCCACRDMQANRRSAHKVMRQIFKQLSNMLIREPLAPILSMTLEDADNANIAMLCHQSLVCCEVEKYLKRINLIAGAQDASRSSKAI